MQTRTAVKRLTTLLLMSLFAIGLTGCPEKGKAERAGEKIDEAVDQMKDGAEDLGDDIGDGMEEAGDDIEDALD